MLKLLFIGSARHALINLAVRDLVRLFDASSAHIRTGFIFILHWLPGPCIPIIHYIPGTKGTLSWHRQPVASTIAIDR